MPLKYVRENFRANYTYEVINDNIIAIIDLDQGNKSVTNDIENVVADIKQELNSDLSGYAIIYKDSMGYWDGVKMTQNSRIDFYSLQETDQCKVINRLLHPLP